MADIKDFGEKIGGAKKDLWRIKGMIRSDVDNLNDREIEKYVTKDLVWKKPDYVKMYEEGGYSSAALLYHKYVRDSLPAKLSGRNLREKAEKYVTFLNEIQEVLADIRKYEDISKMKYRLLLNYGYIDENNNWQEKSNGNPCLCEKRFTNATFLNERGARRLRSEAELQNFPYEYRVKIRGWYVEEREGKYVILRDYMRVVRRDFDSEKEAVEFCRTTLYKQLEEQDVKRKEKLKLGRESLALGKETENVRIERPQLKRIQRTGPDLRNGRHVNGEEILELFNFRGGEFGEWNSDLDRQSFLNHAYDGLMDMANVLNFNTKRLGLGGYEGMKLAIAFGARGEGRALAHYEPSKVVINLTKLKGAGSLAHEYGHALDDFLGNKCGKKGMLSTSCSDFRPNETYKNIELAMVNVTNTMRNVEMTFDEQLEQVNTRIDREKRGMERYIKALKNSFAVQRYNRRTKEYEDATEEEIKEFNEQADRCLEGKCKVSELSELYKKGKGVLPNKDYRDILENYSRSINYSLESIEKAKENGRFEHIQCKQTNYLVNAINIDGKGKKYWSSTVEMFARAFESYIYDKLGFRSDYLVHSVKGTNIYPENMCPYPLGEERERINEAIENLINIIREEMFNGEELQDNIKRLYNLSGEGKAEISKDEYIENKPKEKVSTTDKKQEETVKKPEQVRKAEIDYNLTELKELRELITHIIPKKYAVKDIEVYNKMRLNISRSMSEVKEGSIPDARKIGNCKAWGIINGHLTVDGKAEPWKKAEGIIEAVVKVTVQERYGKGELADMIAEGTTYMICKSFNFDVRTYCMDERFNCLLRNPNNCKSYLNHVVKNYKDILVKLIG